MTMMQAFDSLEQDHVDWRGLLGAADEMLVVASAVKPIGSVIGCYGSEI